MSEEQRHPYNSARKMLQELYAIYLKQGHRRWSVSAEKDGEPNFLHIGLNKIDAVKALELLRSKDLAETLGINKYVISTRGVEASEHATVLEYDLPLPTVPLSTVDQPIATQESRESRAEFIPLSLKDRIEYITHLGDGSYGTVSLVRDMDSRQRFALKVSHRSPEALARAQREASVMSLLDHPHVMKASEQEPDEAWFLFPLADGTLGQLVAWGKVPDLAALTLARDLCGALEHAHASSILHRDLHPDNVLRVDGAWKVADWGLAIGAGNKRLTRTNSAGGSHIWTAPEQLKSMKNADARSDLFSVGRLVQWIASGELPDPKQHGELPEGHELAEFVEALTQLAPEDRPADATAALALLPSDGDAHRMRAPSVRRRASKARITALAQHHIARIDHAKALRGTTLRGDARPLLLLHVSPTAAHTRLNLPALKTLSFRPLPPVSGVSWGVRFNHDGIVACLPDEGPALERFQVGYDGSVEFIDTYIIQRGESPAEVLLPLPLERDIVRFIEHWEANVFEPLGVQRPRVVCLSLVGVAGFELRRDERPPYIRQATFDRDVVTFAPAILEENEDVRLSLKDTFDSLWRAAGEERSLGYSEAGDWLAERHARP